MPEKRYTTRWVKGNLGLATGLVAVLAFSAAAVVNLKRARQETEWVHHAHEVLFGISSVGRIMDELQSGERGYVITGKEPFLDLYSRAKEHLGPELLRVSNLVRDNPEQTSRISLIENEANSIRIEMEKSIGLASRGQAMEARHLVADGRVNSRLDALRDSLTEMENTERANLSRRIFQMRSAADSTEYTLLFGTMVTVVSLLIAAFALNRRLGRQMKAERELAQFFNNSLDMFVITKPDGSFVRFNQKLIEVLGFAREELKSLKILDLVHPSDVAGVALARERRQNGENLSGLEFRMRRKDGTYTWISWQSAFTASENLVYSVGRDVNERRHLEEENVRARQDAQVANQAKSDFLAGMSHEIRTPMNAIIGMADILSETPLSEEQAQYVRVFRAAGNSLLNLINDILDLSRIESGKIEIHDVPFNLRDLVMGVVDLLSVKASQKNLLFEGDIEADVPAQIKGDPDRLRQVLANLLGNSIKFTNQGMVRVAVKPEEKAGRAGLLFTVIDTGIGIPDNSKDRIFGKYERSTATTQLQGSGLGLHISKQLTERMGGQIWFESESGKGSSFYIWMPLVSFTSSLESSPIATGISARPLEILLTDDNEDNRLIVVSYLKKFPHRHHPSGKWAKSAGSIYG